VPDDIEEQIETLHDGRGFVRLVGWRVVRVAGHDAVGWLHDLLTADIASLAPGEACHSLLLGPTGRIRADLHVVRRDDDVVLLQSPDQPDDIGDLLEPFTLSSDVILEPLTGDVEMLAIPGVAADAGIPTLIGPNVGILAPSGRGLDAVMGGVLSDRDQREVSAEAAERWRIEMGIPRMGVDFDTTSLPAEAGLDETIAYDKGCFLGQESVARVRNLGHPPTVLRHVRSDGVLRAGDLVAGPNDVIGSVTSATARRGGWTALVRVPWAGRTVDLTTAGGRPVRDVPHAG
jgi:folate-binding protein YgfZ